MEQEDITKAHCNNCAGKRKHFIIYSHHVEFHDQFADHPSAVEHRFDDYDLLQCAGCDRISFRHTHESSQEPDEHGNIVPTVSYYPPATFRRRPKWLSGWEGISIVWSHDFISRLLHEIYTALHSECLSTAAMGVRALLERVMIDRVGDHSSFAANLTEFQKQGFIGIRQKEALEATLDFGHASMHRDYIPTHDDLRRALDITENIIESVYVSDQRATALKKSVPPRKRK